MGNEPLGLSGVLDALLTPLVFHIDPETGITYDGDLRKDGEVAVTLTIPPSCTKKQITHATIIAREIVANLREAHEHPPTVDIGLARALKGSGWDAPKGTRE